MRSKSNSYNYGQCEICGTRMIEKYIKQDFWIRGELIVIEGVPAGVCPRCGEKIVNSDVGLRIANLIEDSQQIANAPRISVPTMKFDSEEILV